MENNNYNYQKNIPPLSSKDIQKHQDFDALLNQFQVAEATKPTVNTKVRRLWQIGFAAAAVLAGLFIYTNFAAQNKTNSIQTYLASKAYVNPPIKLEKSAFSTYQLEAYEGGTYNYKSGSKIVIPPKAFVNRSGEFVMGKIDIKYREYHDFVDFFMSGIPMEYDSAGVNYVLESAGMIEVYAEQNGERLEIAPEKAIDIQLYSEINVPDPNNPPSYNIYRLDEENRQWVYETIDDIEVLEKVESANDILSEGDNEAGIEKGLKAELAGITKRRQRETSAIEASVPSPPKPVAPTKGDNNNLVLNFDFAEMENTPTVSSEHGAVATAEKAISDLQRQYEGTMWEVLPNQTEFKESMASAQWDDAKIKSAGNQAYIITLIKGDTRVNVNVKPVLMGDDYQAAMAAFEADMAVYQTKMAARETQLANRKKALNEAIQLAQATANQQYEERIAAYRKAGKGQLATNEMMKHKVLNRFQIQSFGVWNCDRPLPPYIYAVKGEFEDQFDTKYTGNIAYIVNKKQNTVRRFYADKHAPIQFDKTADNLLWIVTKENKLALYRPEDFQKIQPQQGNHTFVLNLVEQEINSEEDARKILQF